MEEEEEDEKEEEEKGVNRNRDLMIPRAEKVIPSDSRGSLRMLIDICRVGVLMEQQRFHEAAA